MTEDRYFKKLREHTERVKQRVRDSAEPDPPIRDAATLILLRQDQKQWRVLMGRRSSAHAFMPDVYVFPGGRVDDGDELPKALSELNDDCNAALAASAVRRPRAFPLTAIRETLEETGLIVGRPILTKCNAPENWQPYFDLGATPDLEKISFLGRAVTPPGNKRRFDTRFMVANADEVLMDDRAPTDGAELSDLSWLTLEDAQKTDLPLVTHFVLRRLHKRLSEPNSQSRFDWKWNVDRFDTDEI